MLEYVPISDYPTYQSTEAFQFYYDWVKNSDDGEYWAQQSVEDHHDKFEVPVLHLGGWYDIFLAGTINNYVGIKENGATEQARNNQKLIIGPWIHGPANVGTTEVGDLEFVGADTYPDGEDLNLDTLRRKWFDAWDRDINTAFVEEPPVLIYVMGDNEWRFEDEWPLARTEYTNWYFGPANSSDDSLYDGILSLSVPEDADQSATFDYDPMDPVITQGGNTLFVVSGPKDRSQSDARSLTFTTEVLEQDTEITGPITATLFASSSAVDTDWVVSLSEVYADGRSILIQDGIMRARYRDGSGEPSLIEPDEVYEYTVDLWATSNVFKQGNQIRVSVTSSNFPRWSRNMNVAESPETAADYEVAENTVYFDAERPSHITLPTIPR